MTQRRSRSEDVLAVLAERARRTAPLDVLRVITDEGTQRRKEDSMRKQLTVVTALAVVAASAAPAAARPDVPFPPGTSDAAQGGYESPPPAGTAVATDLRGEFARERPAAVADRTSAANSPARPRNRLSRSPSRSRRRRRTGSTGRRSGSVRAADWSPSSRPAESC